MRMNRRDFLKTSALSAVAASAFPIRSLALSRAGVFTPIRRGVGTFAGRGGTIGWLISDGALVLVDSQFPESAEECLTGIRERSTRSIDLLINSHHHGDHTSGNGVLGAETTNILAHRNVPVLQRASAERRGNLDGQVYADLLYDASWSRDIGDEVVRLKYYGNAHTGGDSVIHFEKADVAHLGDLVFNRRPPYIDLPGGSSTKGWIDVVEKIHADFSDETVFIYGHAHPSFGITGTRDDLLAQADFLSALIEYVEGGIKEGKSSEELLVDHVPGVEKHYSDNNVGGIHRCIRTVFSELSQ